VVGISIASRLRRRTPPTVEIGIVQLRAFEQMMVEFLALGAVGVRHVISFGLVGAKGMAAPLPMVVGSPSPGQVGDHLGHRFVLRRCFLGIPGCCRCSCHDYLLVELKGMPGFAPGIRLVADQHAAAVPPNGTVT
jgi:hypothetical protein